jgi:maleylpyruvate isomerase
MPILYDYFRSSAAFRVRIALGLKGLPFERRFVHLRKAEQRAAAYLKVSPQGLVPALDDAGKVVTQSLAIIEYLDETHPEPPLLPKTPFERARVRAIALAIACDIHPLNNLRVLNYLKDTLEIDEKARTRWYQHWIAEGLGAVEQLLADDRGTGRFCHADRPTLADICLVPQIFNAKRLDCPLEAYPTIQRIFENCMALPAFDAAQPMRQPDAEPGP